MMTRNDYIEGTIVQLDLWGEQFASLKDRVARSAEGRGEQLRKELTALERRRRTLKRQLHRASKGKGRDWEALRRDLEAELGDFRTRAIEVYDDVLEVRS